MFVKHFLALKMKGSNVHFQTSLPACGGSSQQHSIFGTPSMDLDGSVNMKTDEGEHKLDIELHRFLSQQNLTDEKVVDSSAFAQKNIMANAIENAMTEITCPELWIHDQAENEIAKEDKSRLDQLRMDEILSSDEPFFKTHGSDSGAPLDSIHSHLLMESQIALGQAMNSAESFEFNTPSASDSSGNNNLSSDEMLLTNKRKIHKAGLQSECLVKRMKLLYDTISPESLSPLSDNSDFLKNTSSKVSCTRIIPSTTNNISEQVFDENSIRSKSHGLENQNLNFSTCVQNKEPLGQAGPVQSVFKKFTNEFTMQQVAETKRRIINTHKLILNFNFLKDSYIRCCSELKRTMLKLKTSEYHRAQLVKDNEQLKRLALELHTKLEKCTNNDKNSS